MSWQGSCEIPPHASAEDVDAALAALVVDNGRELPDHTVEAVNGAKQCAKQLIYSGAFSWLPMEAGTGYRITLSGHSNPDHRPTPEYANDCVTVGVYQTRTPPP